MPNNEAEKKVTLSSILNTVKEDLENKSIRELEDMYTEDLSDYIHQFIPSDSTALLELAMNDLWLAVDEPANERKNAVEMIFGNIEEYLYDAVEEHIQVIIDDDTGN